MPFWQGVGKMSTMTLPTGWEKYDVGTPNQVTYARPAHSGELKDLVVIKRSFNKVGTLSTSKYQVRMLKGVSSGNTNADVTAAYPDSLVNFEIRNVEDQNIADLQAMMAELGTLISSTTFQDDVTGALPLPY